MERITQRFSFLLTTSLLFTAVACTHKPVEELALADLAVKSAQKAKADALAPDLFRKAENYYLRAKKDFAEGYNDSAAKYAKESRMKAEAAEYKALSKQTRMKSKRLDSEPFGAPPTSDGSELR